MRFFLVCQCTVRVCRSTWPVCVCVCMGVSPVCPHRQTLRASSHCDGSTHASPLSSYKSQFWPQTHGHKLQHWIGFNKAAEDKTLERTTNSCGAFMRTNSEATLQATGLGSVVESTFTQIG